MRRTSPLRRSAVLRVSQVLRRGDPIRPKPMDRRSRRKREIAALDALFRDLILLRDGGRCQYAVTCPQTPQVAHAFSRSRFLTRWDPDNGIALCGGHHIFWAHKHPMRFYEFIKQRLGRVRYNWLLVRSESSAKGQDLMAVRLDLQQQVAVLKQTPRR